jgi:acetyl esterase/lipase
MTAAAPIRLYDGDAPGSESRGHTERQFFSEIFGTEAVVNVVVPMLVPVLPDADANGTAVIVAPGGGFHGLSINSEGFDVAARLASVGFTAFVLKYRLVPGGDDPIAEMVDKAMAGGSVLSDAMEAIAPLAGADGEAAVRLVRERAGEFGVEPDRVGFVGFSAGGNVALRAALSPDPAARPNFVAPIYATARGIELGEPPEDSGPMFLVVATDDELGLTDDSVKLYEQWRSAKLPVELHAYARGGHGFGMRVQHLPSDTWIDRFLDWCASLR